MKNMLLGIVVLFAAVGSAAASLFVAAPTWVHGVRGPISAPITTCRSVGNLCTQDGAPAAICKVNVILANNSIKSTIGYSDSECTVPFRSIQDLIPVTEPTNLRDVDNYPE